MQRSPGRDFLHVLFLTLPNLMFDRRLVTHSLAQTGHLALPANRLQTSLSEAAVNMLLCCLCSRAVWVGVGRGLLSCSAFFVVCIVEFELCLRLRTNIIIVIISRIVVPTHVQSLLYFIFYIFLNTFFQYF